MFDGKEKKNEKKWRKHMMLIKDSIAFEYT